MDEDAQMAAAIALSLADAHAHGVELDGTSPADNCTPDERGAEVSELLPNAEVRPVEQLDVEQMVQPASPLQVADDTASSKAERPSRDEMDNADDSADELATTYSGNELPPQYQLTRRNLADFDATWQGDAEDPVAATARMRLERMRLQRENAANPAVSKPAEQYRKTVEGGASTTVANDQNPSRSRAQRASSRCARAGALCICVLLGWIIWLFLWSLRVI
eukprot:COSAG02_NODE_9356_length_2244_cov_1.745455_3_plen_221_part_00